MQTKSCSRQFSFTFEFPPFVFSALNHSLAFSLTKHRIMEYFDLEGTHKCHWVQLLALHSTIPKNHTTFLTALSQKERNGQCHVLCQMISTQHEHYPWSIFLTIVHIPFFLSQCIITKNTTWGQNTLKIPKVGSFFDISHSLLGEIIAVSWI